MPPTWWSTRFTLTPKRRSSERSSQAGSGSPTSCKRPPSFADTQTQSWDVALSTNGPVFLELNSSGDLNLHQLAHGTGALDDAHRSHLRAATTAESADSKDRQAHSQFGRQPWRPWRSRQRSRSMPLAPGGPQGMLLRSRRPERRRPCPPPASRPAGCEVPEMGRAGQGPRRTDPASSGEARWPRMPSWTCSARP